VALTLHRGTATIAAQDARLVRPGSQGRNTAGDGTESAQTAISIVGKPDMDIRARDRFTVSGVAYEVIAVLPQRQIGTVAQARQLQ
jgi:hypothetical protein